MRAAENLGRFMLGSQGLCRCAICHDVEVKVSEQVGSDVVGRADSRVAVRSRSWAAALTCAGVVMVLTSCSQSPAAPAGAALTTASPTATASAGAATTPAANPGGSRAPVSTVTATITVGPRPDGVAVDTASHTAYVTSSDDDGTGTYVGTVSVIDTRTNTVTKTITVGSRPYGAAVDAGSHTAYVTDVNDGTVFVRVSITNTVPSLTSVTYAV